MALNRLGILLAAAVAFCSCGGGAPLLATAQSGAMAAPANRARPAIVAIGDSLTAGTQSGTNMGEQYANPVSPLAGHVVPPTQENGWFALFFARANGIALDPAKYNLDTPLGDPARSPLPLIREPGLGAQLLYGRNGLVQTHLGCDAFDRDAFSYAHLGEIRLDARAKTYDLSVPGITLHEALTMTAPAVGPPPAPVKTPNGAKCPGYATGAQSLVAAESQLFYPVLGTYRGTVQPFTQANVALSLKPGLAIVWLGANDVFKYIFSAGSSPVVDTPAQFQADLTKLLSQLHAAGARVLVANLPLFLHQPIYFSGGVRPAPSQNTMQYLQLLSGGAVSAAQAQKVVAAIAQPQPRGCGVGSGGYVSTSGLFALIALVRAGTFTGTSCQLDASGPGSGLGYDYLTDAFAAKAGALNARYDAIIAAVAKQTRTPLVDVRSAWERVYEASNAPPYVYRLPGTSRDVDSRFGGRFFTFDGIHPSNTGYAYTANLFIAAANAQLGMKLQPLALAPYYRADPYFVPGPYDGHL